MLRLSRCSAPSPLSEGTTSCAPTDMPSLSFSSNKEEPASLLYGDEPAEATLPKRGHAFATSPFPSTPPFHLPSALARRRPPPLRCIACASVCKPVTLPGWHGAELLCPPTRRAFGGHLGEANHSASAGYASLSARARAHWPGLGARILRGLGSWPLHWSRHLPFRLSTAGLFASCPQHRFGDVVPVHTKRIVRRMLPSPGGVPPAVARHWPPGYVAAAPSSHAAS